MSYSDLNSYRILKLLTKEEAKLYQTWEKRHDHYAPAVTSKAVRQIAINLSILNSYVKPRYKDVVMKKIMLEIKDEFNLHKILVDKSKKIKQII